jgi:hypothetical protein
MSYRMSDAVRNGSGGGEAQFNPVVCICDHDTRFVVWFESVRGLVLMAGHLNVSCRHKENQAVLFISPTEISVNAKRANRRLLTKIL